MIPVAMRDEDHDRFAALSLGLSLLSDFGTPAKDQLAELIQLRHEFAALAGLPAPVSQKADSARAATKALKLPPNITECSMRDIAEAELKAKRSLKIGLFLINRLNTGSTQLEWQNPKRTK